MASRFVSFCTNQAWSHKDIKPMLSCESCMARVLPRLRLGMRPSTSCASSRTTRSWIGAEGFNGGVGDGAMTSGGADAGTGAAVAGAGTGAAVAVAETTGSGWIYT